MSNQVAGEKSYLCLYSQLSHHVQTLAIIFIINQLPADQQTQSGEQACFKNRFKPVNTSSLPLQSILSTIHKNPWILHISVIECGIHQLKCPHRNCVRETKSLCHRMNNHWKRKLKTETPSHEWKNFSQKGHCISDLTVVILKTYKTPSENGSGNKKL